jgi:site-specific DNA-methyltransferase (adenine-specific)
VKSLVYNSDCLTAMRAMDDNQFDLACVDVPYGIGEDGSNNKSRAVLATSKDYVPFTGNDLECPSQEYFDQLFRVSKNQIIWGANHFIERINKNSSCWIVWDKVNGATDFADCELAWTSFKTAVRQFTFQWQGMLQGNMKNKEERIHPTQKPVALYKWLFHTYAEQGQTILDTHCGSGSSRIAAHDLEMNFVGFELSKHYFDVAEDRFANHIAQNRLF